MLLKIICWWIWHLIYLAVHRHIRYTWFSGPMDRIITVELPQQASAE